jgi:hypothetical protein
MGVVNHPAFKDCGLEVKDYLKAALKQPQLFYQLPETIVSNIMGVVNHPVFKDCGLEVKDYLKAALKQPPLFYQSPKTIVSNIMGVVNHPAFKDCGLEVKDYLKAALKQPPLFCQSPETIAEHFYLIKRLHDKGVLSTQLNVLDISLNTPILLCLSNDNFHLRYIFARYANIDNQKSTYLKQTRGDIERDFVGLLSENKADTNNKSLSLADFPEKNRIFVRQMIKTKIIKGYTIA